MCRWICDNGNNSSFVEMYTEESSNAFCLIDVTKVSNCSIDNNNNNNNCTRTSLILEDNYNLYISMTFWSFVLLMSLGNIGFNISNCISDAICFDVLGTYCQNNVNIFFSIIIVNYYQIKDKSGLKIG